MALAAAFHRRVIAEGVETQAHGDKLLQLGCELGQGFGIAPPMPAHEVVDWVHRYQSNFSAPPTDRALVSQRPDKT